MGLVKIGIYSIFKMHDVLKHQGVDELNILPKGTINYLGKCRSVL